MTRRLRLTSCSLSPAELSERGAAWLAVRERVNVVEHARFDGGFRLAFHGGREDVEVVGALVAAEQLCCSWAEWQLDRTPEGAILTVSGQEELIAPLAHAFLDRETSGEQLPVVPERV